MKTVELGSENVISSSLQVLSSKQSQVPVSALGVAFSGGLDSTVLLHACLKFLPERKIYAFHVCHNLRPDVETQKELQIIVNNAVSAGVSLFIAQLDSEKILSQAKNEGVEAAARKARYQALEALADEMGVSDILLAHHADDDLETQVIGFLTGARARMSAGIPQRKGKIFRPFLNVSHDALVSYAKYHQLQWSVDSSNQNTDFLRNQVRKNVLPMLRKSWLGFDNARQTAKERILAEQDALDHVADDVKLETKPDGSSAILRTEFVKLLPAIRERVLFRMLNNARAQEPSVSDLAINPDPINYRISARALRAFTVSDEPVVGTEVYFGQLRLIAETFYIVVEPRLAGARKNGYLLNLSRGEWLPVPGWGSLRLDDNPPLIGDAKSVQGLEKPILTMKPDRITMKVIEKATGAKVIQEDWITLRGGVSYAVEKKPSGRLVRLDGTAGSETITFWLSRKSGDAN